MEKDSALGRVKRFSRMARTFGMSKFQPSMILAVLMMLNVTVTVKEEQDAEGSHRVWCYHRNKRYEKGAYTVSEGE